MKRFKKNIEIWLFALILLVMLAIGINRMTNPDSKSKAECEAQKSSCGSCAHKNSCNANPQ